MSAIARDGADALFALLDSADADVTNPDRPSVV
ncbi:suppressor of fused domain protein, partial [Dietzia sp. B19]|nr:suppressor of fused domain protein [Dietzia sp. B19]